MTWYRVFYRNGKGEPVSAEDLPRILARKTPVVIHHETAIIHRCQHCGTEGPWEPEWLAYPVLAHHPEHVQARASGSTYIACSRDCFGDLIDRSFGPPSWMDPHREPNRDVDRCRSLYTAQRAEDQRKRELTEHRKVPMVEWKGQGFCKWCNGRMTEADKPSTMWHRGCAQQWKLHSLLHDQTKFCRGRDGRGCAYDGPEGHADGCSGVGGELDHRVPLWKVRDLPPDERRSYYGPDNIWLLSNACHAAKTAREAAERAALRRE